MLWKESKNLWKTMCERRQRPMHKQKLIFIYTTVCIRRT